MKRILIALLAFAAIAPEMAGAYSGGGGVWATKTGEFVAKNFPGDSTGVKSALSWVSTGGSVRAAGDISFKGPITIPSGVELSLGQATWTFDGSLGILISSKATLSGQGYGSSIIKAANTFNGRALIMNADTTGGQQNCRIVNLQVEGNKGGGARVDAGIKLKKIFVETVVQDVLVNNCTGVSLRLDGGSFGPVYVRNVWLNNGNDDGLLLDGSGGQIGSPFLYGLTIERWGTGKAAVRFDGASGGSACIGGVLDGLYMEEASDVTADGVVVKNWSNLSVRNVFTNGAGPMNYGVRITGQPTSAVFGAYNCTFQNIYAGNDTILFDQVNNIAFTTANGRGVYEYRTPSKSYNWGPIVVASDSLRIGKTLQIGLLPFAGLISNGNGTLIYCSDCTKATPCASGGTGALAKRVNGAWDCN